MAFVFFPDGSRNHNHTRGRERAELVSQLAVSQDRVQLLETQRAASLTAQAAQQVTAPAAQAVLAAQSTSSTGASSGSGLQAAAQAGGAQSASAPAGRAAVPGVPATAAVAAVVGAQVADTAAVRITFGGKQKDEIFRQLKACYRALFPLAVNTAGVLVMTVVGISARLVADVRLALSLLKSNKGRQRAIDTRGQGFQALLEQMAQQNKAQVAMPTKKALPKSAAEKAAIKLREQQIVQQVAAGAAEANAARAEYTAAAEAKALRDHAEQQNFLDVERTNVVRYFGDPTADPVVVALLQGGCKETGFGYL